MRHIANRVVIGAAASALICGAVGAMPKPRPVSYEVMPTAAIVESSSTLGFADSDLYQLSTTDIDQQLDMMQALGVQNVRISIAWASVEAQQGQYNWTATDYVINAAHQRGMGILGVLNETPAWAGTPVLAGMPNPQVFAGFAELVAQRYVDEIFAYSIWNEPNAVNSLDPVDPAAYTTLLQAAYPLIKQVGVNNGTEITVIGGVVGAGLTEGGVSMNPVDFIQDFLATWPTIAGTGPMFIYTLVDTDTGSSNKQDNLGVYYSDLTAKQAVKAIIDYINAIPGPSQPTSPNHPIIETITAVVHWAGAATRALAHSAANAVINVAEVIANVVTGLARATANAFSGAVRLAGTVVTGIVQAVANAVRGVAGFVKDALPRATAAGSTVRAVAAGTPTAAFVPIAFRDSDGLAAPERTADRPHSRGRRGHRGPVSEPTANTAASSRRGNEPAAASGSAARQADESEPQLEGTAEEELSDSDDRTEPAGLTGTETDQHDATPAGEAGPKRLDKTGSESAGEDAADRPTEESEAAAA